MFPLPSEVAGGPFVFAAEPQAVPRVPQPPSPSRESPRLTRSRHRSAASRGAAPQLRPYGPLGDRAQVLQYADSPDSCSSASRAPAPPPGPRPRTAPGRRSPPRGPGRGRRRPRRRRSVVPASTRASTFSISSIHRASPAAVAGDEPGLGLGPGQQLGEDGDMAGGALLGMQLPPQLQEFGEAADPGEALAVVRDALLRAVPAGGGEEFVDAAEVVEDQGLVDSCGGGDAAGRGLGEALLGERLQRTGEQFRTGIGAQVRASSRKGRSPARTPRSAMFTNSAEKDPS